MSHIERRQKEKEEIKKRILEAAREIGAAEGWHSLTIRKIADKIEYTPPIVYEYFENKEDLIREIVYQGFSQMTRQFKEAYLTEQNPREFITKISLIHWDFAFNNKEIYKLMFSLERQTPSEEMIENMKMIENTFLSFIKEEDPVHEIIFSWMCLMTGAIAIAFKFPDLPHQEGAPRDVFARIIQRFVKTL